MPASLRPSRARRSASFATPLLTSLALTGGLLAAAAPTAAAEIALGATLDEHAFAVADGAPESHEVHYWSNDDLDAPATEVTRVVVVVHGDSRNADDYGRYVAEAATDAGVLSSTVVLAPLFGTIDDAPDTADLRWTSASWKRGGRSTTVADTESLSSFQVMDQLVVAARQAYPEARIAVTGHSAGGQFVQRYAALAQQSDVQRYAVMNPGSYMYLDNRRWFGKKLRPLSATELADCPDYDDFKYGLQDRRDDLGALADADVRARYSSSPVTYLLGELDTERDSSLDVGCEADIQGAERKTRGNRFFRALSRTVTHAHTKVQVPGVAHSGHGMLTSDAARPLLFG